MLNFGLRSGVAAVTAAVLSVAIASPVLADTVDVAGRQTGQHSTANVVCEFNSQTNTFTFTLTNTSNITMPGSTATVTSIGFDLPPGGNANASGLNGFTGSQAPSLSSDFDFSDGDLGDVPGLSSLVLDFGFTTGPSGTFETGLASVALLPGESASFTVSGAAFTGFTEDEICNAILVRFEGITGSVATTDVATTGSPSFAIYKPDALIKRSGGPVRGNDVFSTDGTGQTLTMWRSGPALRRVWVTVQNQGAAADSFHLAVTGTTPAGYVLRYFRGRTNEELTASVEAGTFVTPELAPGTSFRIRVRVQTTAAAQVGSELTRLFTFSSDSNSAAQDAVRLIVRRV